MIRLLIQRVKVDDFDDVIMRLEQHGAVDGVCSRVVVLQRDDGAVANVFSPPGLDQKKQKTKSLCWINYRLPSLKRKVKLV